MRSLAMSSWLSPETNTVLLSGLIAVIGALATWAVAWLRVQTRRLNDMAEANREILNKNTEIVEDVRRQTDGMNIKLQKIAAAAAFTKGRVKGRAEGESTDPYEDLYKLEEEIGSILDIEKMKPKT